MSHTVPKILYSVYPGTIGADAMANVWFLGQIYMDNSQTYSVASAPAVTGSVFKQIFRLFLGQWPSNVIF